MCVCSTRYLYRRKKSFLLTLLVLVNSVAESETRVIAGDFNGHVGQHSQGLSWHHGGCAYGTWNQERMRILDLCAATDLAVTNTFLRKRNSQLVTYNSGGYANEVDCILVRRTELKLSKNAKVIGIEEFIPQHTTHPTHITCCCAQDSNSLREVTFYYCKAKVKEIA